LIFSSLIILDIGLYFVAKMKSTKTTFINDKFSKISHFKLNNSKNKDIIFIGSSRTFYQISTNVFKKNGLDIYNFGISGAQFDGYPTLIPYINNSNAKEIVISLQVSKLFDKLDVTSFPTIEEIKYYYDIDKIKFLKSIKQWIINRHLFLQYSEPIFYKIKATYNKFNPHKVLEIANADLFNNKKDAHNSINYLKLVNCKVFDIKKIDYNHQTLKCTNGDGILIGSIVDINVIENKKLKILDLQTIKYFQKLIDDIDKKNTKISIILEPIFHNPYSYNFNKIQKQFKNIKIIDLTNFKVQDDYWSDIGHLNYKGREKYSQHLSDILK
jgi:hypothetical protein